MPRRKAHVKTTADVECLNTDYCGTGDADTLCNNHEVAQAVTSFESPESGTVIRARYDPETRQMFIDLRKSAVTYRYTGIDAPLWEEFVQSDSKGRFFAARIRPLYVGVKV